MTQDVGSDPTVCVPDFCTLCGQQIKCPFCQEAHPDVTSLCNELMEDIMLLDELAEEEEDDEGEEAEHQPLQKQPEAQHA